MGIFDNPLTTPAPTPAPLPQSRYDEEPTQSSVSDPRTYPENISTYVPPRRTGGSGGGSRRTEQVVENKEYITDQRGSIVAVTGNVVTYEGTQQEIDRQKELRRLQLKGYDTSNIYYTSSGGMSIASDVVKRQEYEAQFAGTTFIDTSGNRFSSNPDTVTKRISQSPFQNPNIEYFSGRTEEVQGQDLAFDSVLIDRKPISYREETSFSGLTGNIVPSSIVELTKRASQTFNPLLDPGRRLLNNLSKAGAYKISQYDVDNFYTPLSYSRETAVMDLDSDTYTIGRSDYRPNYLPPRVITDTISDSLITTPQEFENQITFLSNWEQSQAKRIGNVDKFFTGKGGNSYLERLGRGGLSLPGLTFTAFPETIAIDAYKGYLGVKGAFIYPEETSSEFSRAGSMVLPSLLTSFDVRQPEGLLNVLSLVALPSALRYGKNVYIKAGTTTVPEYEVFSSQVLSGAKNLPTVSSIKEALSLFNVPDRKSYSVAPRLVSGGYSVAPYVRYPIIEFFGRPPKNYVVATDTLAGVPVKVSGYTVPPKFVSGYDVPARVVVQTSSPAKLVGGEFKSMPGTKGSAGLEDPVLYVTPKGEGSPKFLGIGAGAYDITFNPIKAFKNLFSIPTVTEISTKGVELLPRSVVSKPGFTAVDEFYNEIGSKTGKAYITKRSEIGQGNIKRQTLIAKESGTFWGRFYEKGRRYKEPGTTELEAGVRGKYVYYPRQSFFGKLKGFEKSTSYLGENVAIRRVKLVSKDYVLSKSDISRGATFISAEQLASEASSLYSPKVSSPYSSIKYSPKFSAKAIPSITETPYSFTSRPTSLGSFSKGVSYASLSSYSLSSSKVSATSSYGRSGRSSSKSAPKSFLSSVLSSTTSSIPLSITSSSTSYSPSSPGKYSGYSFGGYSSTNSSRYKPITPFRPTSSIPRLTIPRLPTRNERRGNQILGGFRPIKYSKAKSEVYVLPDLYSVNITEAQTGKEAIAPRLTPLIKRQAQSVFGGLGGNIIYTEQIRTGKVKLF